MWKGGIFSVGVGLLFTVLYVLLFVLEWSDEGWQWNREVRVVLLVCALLMAVTWLGVALVADNPDSEPTPQTVTTTTRLR